MVFCSLAKTSRKPKKQKNKKVQTHGQGLGRGLAGDMGLNFLVFFVFLVFPCFFCNLAKTSRKPKKTKKKSDPWARSGERPGWGHGSDFFPLFFLHVFHVKMLSSQYLSKNARFYNLHTCAPHGYPFCIYIYIHLKLELRLVKYHDMCGVDAARD